MKTSDYIVLGAVVIGGYFVYKTFIAPNREAAVSTINNTANAVYPSTYTKNAIMARYDNWDGSSTTYKFTESDLSKFNWAQRLLLNIGIPDEWVLQ